MKRLLQERSPYLRHAAAQPIDWYPWSDEAFERAKQEDKPVFLSSGGVWCHWCHVMARESFSDDEVARLLNEHFISVKIDRDERPDLDRRYQQAVAAMGGSGGWPLSVFLTPEREAFYGGTYFPPGDQQGRPGFRNVLRAVLGFYREKRQDANEYAARVMGVLTIGTARPGELGESQLRSAAEAMLTHYDPANGGFGTAPKFPMPGALEFLIRRYARERGERIGTALRRTLDAMAGGGIHDQLAGGFHRYATDAAWIIPHFEKMADDNASLLRTYTDGYAVFGDERYADVARGIIRFTRAVLSDPGGGFYASQDADVTPEDEGGYFTWTAPEFLEVLHREERDVLTRHLLHQRGAMHHDPAKHVLFVAMSAGDIARELDRPLSTVEADIRRGKEKLLARRAARTAPFIDQSIYTSLNGRYISAFLLASRVLGDAESGAYALKSLERILRGRFDGDSLLHAEGIPAGLDDHVFLAEALISAYETTGEREYLEQGERLMTACLKAFWDTDGGFFDTKDSVLGVRLKRIEDVPHASANAAAAMLLLKLWNITDRAVYRDAAVRTLQAFSGTAADYGVHAGAYFAALDALFFPLRLTVEARPASALAEAARSRGGPAAIIRYGEDRGQVVPCMAATCFEPITDPSELAGAVGKLTHHG